MKFGEVDALLAFMNVGWSAGNPMLSSEACDPDVCFEGINLGDLLPPECPVNFDREHGNSASHSLFHCGRLWVV